MTSLPVEEPSASPPLSSGAVYDDAHSRASPDGEEEGSCESVAADSIEASLSLGSDDEFEIPPSPPYAFAADPASGR